MAKHSLGEGTVLLLAICCDIAVVGGVGSQHPALGLDGRKTQEFTSHVFGLGYFLDNGYPFQWH